MVILNILTILCIGLLIGTEFAVSVFIGPVLEQLDNVARPTAIRLFAARLGTAMPFWYILSLLLLVTQAVLHRHEHGLSLLISASAIWTAVIVFSVIVLVPINNRMARLDPDTWTETNRQAHKRWDALHRVRVALLTAAMACLLLAIHI
jgi:Predicted integral membrane protein